MISMERADVIVVGYGGAGAVAAIAAHDLGARVLILEKQPSGAHYTNTQMSGAIFLHPNDCTKALRYLEGLAQAGEGMSWTESRVLQAFVERASESKAWVENMGAKLRLFALGGEHRDVPGCDGFERWQFLGCGLGLHRFLKDRVEHRGIQVLYGARAEELILNRNGEVAGVRARSDEGKVADVVADRAVIMTTGGFEFDERMKLNYLKVYPTYFYGTTANTGDGHRMVASLGAEMWHMNCCSARLVAKFPDYPIAFSLNLSGRRPSTKIKEALTDGPACGYVIVDRDAKRFTNENFKGHAVYYELPLYDSQRMLYPRVPCHWIFDRRRFDAAPLPILNGGPSGPVQLYRWSRDNRAELERGWILRGDSLKELAGKLGLPAGRMAETVERYNDDCRRGVDSDFGRPADSLTALDSPPYFAVRLYPGGPNTLGGPRRNERAQVLDTRGRPIPRLYAAGEFGSLYGMLYPGGGGNIAECIAFGRIAAENAARETPR